jgi:hypothetical protein
MRKHIFAVAMTVCIPVAVFAQKRGAGSDPGASSPAPASSSASSSASRTPTSRDLADLNPAALLVDKKKKVSLADSTVAQLKAVAKQIDERNKPFFTSYDSVRKWTVPLSDNVSARAMKDLSTTAQQQISAGSPAEQARMQASLRDLRVLLAEFKTRHEADLTDALAIVPDAQKPAAKALLGQQTDDFDKLVGGRP